MSFLWNQGRSHVEIPEPGREIAGLIGHVPGAVQEMRLPVPGDHLASQRAEICTLSKMLSPGIKHLVRAILQRPELDHDAASVGGDTVPLRFLQV